MKTFAALLTALLIAIGLTAVTTTTASAAPATAASLSGVTNTASFVGHALRVTPAIPGAYDTGWECVSIDGGQIDVCEIAGWDQQADGSGVRLEWFEQWTKDGCDRLEDSGGKFGSTRLGWRNPNTGEINYMWNWDSRPCSWFINPSDAGKDKGVMTVGISTKARVDNGGDRWIGVEWELRPAGDSKLLHAHDLPA